MKNQEISLYPLKIELHKKYNGYYYKFIDEYNNIIEDKVNMAYWYSQKHNVVAPCLTDDKIVISSRCPGSNNLRQEILIPLSLFKEGYYIEVEEIFSDDYDDLIKDRENIFVVDYYYTKDGIDKFLNIKQIKYAN